MSRPPVGFDDGVILVAIGVLVVGGVALLFAAAFMLEIMMVMMATGLVAAVFASYRLHEDLTPGARVRVVEANERTLVIGILIAFVVVFGGLLYVALE